MSLPRPLLSFIFGLFKQTSLKLFQQIYVKKCPSSIRCWDSNLQPLEHESPPITTRPGLPPYGAVFVAQLVEQLHLWFKSSHWHFIFCQCQLYWKDENPKVPLYAKKINLFCNLYIVIPSIKTKMVSPWPTNYHHFYVDWENTIDLVLPDIY